MNAAVVTLVLGVAVPILTAVGGYVSTRLGNRDERASIRADIELLMTMPDDFNSREALQRSIEARVLAHALPYPGIRKVTRMMIAIALGVFGAVAVLSFLIGGDHRATGANVFLLSAIICWILVCWLLLDHAHRRTTAVHSGWGTVEWWRTPPQRRQRDGAPSASHTNASEPTL